MRYVRLFGVGLAFLLFMPCWTAARGEIESLPFEEIGRGPISYYRYGDPTFSGLQMHITDRQSWERFWALHTLHLSEKPPLPEVSFPKENVIVLLLGYQTSGDGPSIQVTGIQRAGREIRVWILEDRTPGSLDVVTNPYQIIKTGRLRGSLFFDHTEPEGEICFGPGDCPEDHLCDLADPTCSSPAAGVCHYWPPGAFCTEVYMPVCGCDGMTYGNNCFRRAEEAILQHLGECP